MTIRPMHLVFLLFGAHVAVLGGCEPGVLPEHDVFVRDSAGVTIVVNRGPLPEARGEWSLSPEPRAVIGSLDARPEGQLYRVRGARRLPDGRIALGNAGTSEIRIYDARGAHLASLGGEGEGPGEFSSPALVGLLGDSLVVLDRQQRRVSLVHPELGFVRSFTPADSLGYYFMAGWLLEGGSLLLQDLPHEDYHLEDGFHRSPVPLRSCDLTGALAADFGTVPGAEQVIATVQGPHGLATTLSDVPLGRSPRIAAQGGRVYYGTQDSYEISVLDAEARLVRRIRWERDPVSATAAHRRAWIEAELSGIEKDRARERRAQLEEMPSPEYLPAHGDIAVDAAGFLFVEEYGLPGSDGTVLSVFDPGGRLTGRLDLPAGLEVMEVGPDYLLGLHKDEMGVEQIRLYGLTRPE